MATVKKDQGEKKMTAPKKTAPKKGEEVQVVDAEHIPQPNTEVAPPEIDRQAIIQAEVDKRVAVFDPNLKKIAEWKTEILPLIDKVTGLECKEEIKALKEKKSFLRTKRTTLEKSRVDQKADIIAVGKGIDVVAKGYEGGIVDIETLVDKKLEEVEKWESAEATRKLEEANKERDRRVDAVKAAGMTFDGSFYVIGENIAMDLITITAMSISDFEALVFKVQLAKKDIDEKKRIADEEEQQRLQKEDDNRKEQQRIADENAKETARINKEREDMRQEKMEMRDNMLTNAGFTFQGHNMCYVFINNFHNISKSKEAVELMDAAEFKAFVNAEKDNIASAIAKQTEKDTSDAAERKRIADKAEEDRQEDKRKRDAAALAETNRYNARTTELIGIGLAIVGDRFDRRNEFNDEVTIACTLVRTTTDEEWQRLFDSIKERVTRLNGMTEHKRGEVIKKKEMQKPEIQRSLEYFAGLYGVVKPEVTTPELQVIMADFTTEFSRIVSAANDKLGKLQQ